MKTLPRIRQGGSPGWTRVVVLIGLLWLFQACASIPPPLRGDHPELVRTCPDDLSELGPAEGAVLVSFELMMLGGDEFFLEMHNPAGRKHLMPLEPKVFGRPPKDAFGPHPLPVRRYCYRMKSGTYRIRKVHAFLTFRSTINGQTTESTEWREIPFPVSMRVASDTLSYWGRLMPVDRALVGKNYGQRMWLGLRRTFLGIAKAGSVMGDSLHMEQSDSLAEDKTWMDRKYPGYRELPVVFTGGAAPPHPLDPEPGGGEAP